MAKLRAFLSDECEVDGDHHCLLDERESHHLGKVLRIGAQDQVELLDGQGTVRLGVLAGERKARRLTIKISKTQTHQRSPREISLLLALPKQKALDAILRAATEIGVRRIQILFSEHCEARWKTADLQSKSAKARQTLIEACKQCGLPFLPELCQPQTLPEWVNSVSTDRNTIRGWVGSLRGHPPRLSDVLVASPPEPATESWFAVGPEGDFSDAEYDQLEDFGLVPVALGAYTLRTETAAIYGLAVADQFIHR